MMDLGNISGRVEFRAAFNNRKNRKDCKKLWKLCYKMGSILEWSVLKFPEKAKKMLRNIDVLHATCRK